MISVVSDGSEKTLKQTNLWTIPLGPKPAVFPCYKTRGVWKSQVQVDFLQSFYQKLLPM